MSYIEKEALRNKLHEAGGCDAEDNTYSDGWDKAITEAIRILDETPASDVAKVKHGTWYRGMTKTVVYAGCSVCRKRMHYFSYGYAYCPSCGAKMDGKRSENGT